MALNTDFVGRSYPPSVPYLVGREKVREFARALGVTDPVTTDIEAARARGYADVVAPPTYAIRLSLAAVEKVATDPELGLDYARVVHGDQRFEYTRPIVAGDELVCQVTIDGIRSVAGNDMITARADITTTAGEHVVTSYSVLVARGTDEESS
jgi:acyl dehydratase